MTVVETSALSTNGRPRRRPVVPVAVEFGTPLARFADDAAGEFRGLLAAELSVLLERLGIGGEPSISVAGVESRRPVRVNVHGCFQPYPPSLVRRAWLATAPEGAPEPSAAAPATPPLGFPNAWLDELTRADLADRGLVLTFAARLVRAVVLQRPSCLLAREQTVRYARRIGLAVEDVAPVLGDLLDLGVCVTDYDVVHEVVREGSELRRPPEDTIEAALARMRSHVVELLVHPATMRSLLALESSDDRFSVYSSQVDRSLQALFRGLERQFFDRFGFLLPRVDWVATPSMREGMMSVKIDGWSSLPVPLVLPGERLVFPVDAAGGAQAEGAPARCTLHPVSGAPCAIVEGDKATFDAMGVTTWGPIDFVVLNLFAELAARPGRVLGMEEVEYQLARLRFELLDLPVDGSRTRELAVDGTHPELVYAALAHHSVGDLTRVFRAFVEEDLSMRNLPEILGRLVDYDTVPLERDSLLLVDDRVAAPSVPSRNGRVSRSHYEFCRKQLKSYVTARHSWAENTIVAYLLEPELEARAPRLAAAVRSGGPRSRKWEEEAEAFRDAVWTELQFLAPGPIGQVVLTTPGARSAVRALLEPELPELPVLAYSELRPDVNVQPIARIGLA